MKAINAARLCLHGDGSHKVSLDKAIKTMRETGADMKTKYKETSRGGLAVNVIERWTMDTPQSSAAEYVLTLDCPETRGIVHAVSGFLLEQGCDILESKQLASQDDGPFFMRLHFASAADSPGPPSPLDSLRAPFRPGLRNFCSQLPRRAAPADADQGARVRQRGAEPHRPQQHEHPW